MNSRAAPIFAIRGYQKEMSQAAKLCMVAEDILQGMPGRAGHLDAIVELAVEQNMNLGLSADDLKQKISGALAADVKRKGTVFAKVTYKKAGKTVGKKGWYKIKAVSSMRLGAALAPPVQADSIYFGKFGEYAVISELLYWGFNASPMTVDRGVDVVAEKNNKYFYIQVKAGYESDYSWKFTIKRSSYDANHSSMMNYIFVLRSSAEAKNTFIVIPSTHIDTLIKSKSIKSESSALSLRISSIDKGKSWRLNNTDCSMFVNAFGQLL